MNKLRIPFLWFVLLGIFVFISGNNKISDFTSDLIIRHIEYNNKYHPERISLHTDKTSYLPDDTLWFKAYIVDYSSNKFSSSSNTLEVYLVNEEGEELKKSRFVVVKGMAFGQIELPETLGYYKLLAYSSWMKNFEFDNVYQKEIQIVKLAPDDFHFIVEFDKPFYRQGDRVIARIKTFSNAGLPVPDVDFRYEVSSDKSLKRGVSSTNNKGLGTVSFIFPNEKKFFQPTFRISKKDEDQVNELITVIPTDMAEIDLRFFPEGGDLVQNLRSQVGFKAVDKNGFPFNFTAEILNQDGEVVQQIESVHHGMGSFYMLPQTGQSYSARITCPAGVQKVYTLPVAKKSGFVLNKGHVSDENIEMKVLSSYPEKKLIFITVKVRGLIYWSVQGKVKDLTIIKIPLKDLPQGIARITLFNKTYKPVAERLVYVDKNQLLNVHVEGVKTIYQPRDRVGLKIKVTDAGGNPVVTNLSFSVADSSLMFNSRLSRSNLISDLILESGIKGRLFNPEDYFDKNNPDAMQNLDLVLLTQGWRRYAWEKYLDHAELPEPVNYDIISGKVIKVVTKKGVPNATVNILNWGPGGYEITKINSDEQGIFNILPVFEDFTHNKMIIRATRDKGGTNVRLAIFPEPSDSINYKLRVAGVPLSAEQVEKRFYRFFPDVRPGFNSERELYIGDDILIPEVEISGKARIQESDIEFGPVTKMIKRFGESSKGADLTESTDFSGLVRQVKPNIIINYDAGQIFDTRGRESFTPTGGSPSTFEDFMTGSSNEAAPLGDGRPSQSPMLYVLDNVIVGTNYHDLDQIQIDQIKEIGVLDGKKAYFYYGKQGNGGVVYVTTYKGDEKPPAKPDPAARGLAIFRDYDEILEFYHPVYDTPESRQVISPDIRTTIYWNPMITTDENGEALVTFYNGDVKSPKVGIIQGIGMDGGIGFTSFKYAVKY